MKRDCAKTAPLMMRGWRTGDCTRLSLVLALAVSRRLMSLRACNLSTTTHIDQSSFRRQLGRSVLETSCKERRRILLMLWGRMQWMERKYRLILWAGRMQRAAPETEIRKKVFRVDFSLVPSTRNSPNLCGHGRRLVERQGCEGERRTHSSLLCRKMSATSSRS